MSSVTATAVLDRKGLRIGERRFAELVTAALEELAPAGSADPLSELSEADAAALHAVDADLDPRRRGETDPRSTGAAAAVALLASGFTVSAAAERIGVDPSRVRHRLAAGELLGSKRGRGWSLPAWQFLGDGVLPGLAKIAPLLRPVYPVVAASFMATPQPELLVRGRAVTPRQWLAGGGDPAPIAVLARDLAEQF